MNANLFEKPCYPISCPVDAAVQAVIEGRIKETFDKQIIRKWAGMKAIRYIGRRVVK